MQACLGAAGGAPGWPSPLSPGLQQLMNRSPPAPLAPTPPSPCIPRLRGGTGLSLCCPPRLLPLPPEEPSRLPGRLHWEARPGCSLLRTSGNLGLDRTFWTPHFASPASSRSPGGLAWPFRHLILSPVWPALGKALLWCPGPRGWPPLLTPRRPSPWRQAPDTRSFVESRDFRAPSASFWGPLRVWPQPLPRPQKPAALHSGPILEH